MPLEAPPLPKPPSVPKRTVQHITLGSRRLALHAPRARTAARSGSRGPCCTGWINPLPPVRLKGRQEVPRAEQGWAVRDGLPAAGGKLWQAEAGGRSEGGRQRGPSPARPSAPGTTALSLQRGAAASPSGGGMGEEDRGREGKDGEEEVRKSRNEGSGGRRRRKERVKKGQGWRTGQGRPLSGRQEGKGNGEDGRKESIKRRKHSENTVAMNALKAKRNRAQLPDHRHGLRQPRGQPAAAHHAHSAPLGPAAGGGTMAWGGCTHRQSHAASGLHGRRGEETTNLGRRRDRSEGGGRGQRKRKAGGGNQVLGGRGPGRQARRGGRGHQGAAPHRL